MNTTNGDRMIDSSGVCAEVGDKSKMTINRWQRDPRVAFPQPDLTINGRNYWYLATINAWKSRMKTQSVKPAAPFAVQQNEVAPCSK